MRRRKSIELATGLPVRLAGMVHFRMGETSLGVCGHDVFSWIKLTRTRGSSRTYNKIHDEVGDQDCQR